MNMFSPARAPARLDAHLRTHACRALVRPAFRARVRLACRARPFLPFRARVRLAQVRNVPAVFNEAKMLAVVVYMFSVTALCACFLTFRTHISRASYGYPIAHDPQSNTTDRSADCPCHAHVRGELCIFSVSCRVLAVFTHSNAMPRTFAHATTNLSFSSRRIAGPICYVFNDQRTLQYTLMSFGLIYLHVATPTLILLPKLWHRNEDPDHPHATDGHPSPLHHGASHRLHRAGTIRSRTASLHTNPMFATLVAFRNPFIIVMHGSDSNDQ
jgi:hypothetical protein